MLLDSVAQKGPLAMHIPINSCPSRCRTSSPLNRLDIPIPLQSVLATMRATLVVARSLSSSKQVTW
jgi:hypothetical protein